MTRMKGGVYTRNEGRTWGYVTELGDQPALRCDTCKKNHWLEGDRLRACPKCGAELREINARRQVWHPATFKTKTEARRARTKAQVTADDGGFVEPTKETVAEYMRRWLVGVESEVEPTTFVNYKGHVERHIIPGSLGRVPVAKLTTAMVKEFYGELAKKQRAVGAGTLSKTTIHRVHSTLHCALEGLVDSRRLKANPAHKAKPRKRKSEKPELKVWSPEQLTAFLSFVRDDRLFALWRLLSWTGVRRGECVGLRWDDLDLEARKVAVRRSVGVANYKTHIGPPKSGEARVIDIDAETAAILKAHRARQIAERMALGLGGAANDGFVFSQVDGSMIHPDRISKMFEALVAKSELPRVRLHDLRHAHASHMLASGANIKLVSERLGHASVLITLDIYAHTMPTEQRGAVEALAKVYA